MVDFKWLPNRFHMDPPLTVDQLLEFVTYTFENDGDVNMPLPSTSVIAVPLNYKTTLCFS